MTHEPTWHDASWPLRPCPHTTPWWQRWMWWRRDGVFEVSNERLSLRSGDGRQLGAIQLGEPAAVHLEVWPANRRRGWLSVTIGQQTTRLTVQTRLPWSAIPDDAPLLMRSCPVLLPEQFAELWEMLRFAASVHGAPELPDIHEGRYSGVPRGLELLRVSPVQHGEAVKPARLPVPAERQREALKAQVREMDPDEFLRCAWCVLPTDVKAKNMVRHYDQQHSRRR